MSTSDNPSETKPSLRAGDLRRSPGERVAYGLTEAVKQTPLLGSVVSVVLALFSTDLSAHRLLELLRQYEAQLDHLPEEVRGHVVEWFGTDEGHATLEMALRANDEEVIDEKRRLFVNLLVNAAIACGDAPLYEISLLRGLTREHLALLAVAEQQRSLGVIPGGNPEGSYPNQDALATACKEVAERHRLSDMPFIQSAFYDLVGKQVFEVSITMEGERPRPRFEQLAHHLMPAGIRLLDLLKEPQPE